MKRRLRCLLAEIALPGTTFARRKLMALEGWLLRIRYFSDGTPSPQPPELG